MRRPKGWRRCAQFVPPIGSKVPGSSAAGAELAERSGFGLGGSDLLAVSGVLAKSALSPTAGEVEPGGRKREKNEAGEPKQPVGRFALREPDATG